MLETLREYAAEKLDDLGEAGPVRNKYLAAFLCLAEDAERQIHGRDEASWFQRLEAEHDNLRAAMDWAEESGQIEAALQLAGALYWFWYARGHWSEGQQRLVRLLSSPAPDECSVERARALFAAAWLTTSLGDLNLADAYSRSAIVLGEQLGRDGVRVLSLACAFRAFSREDLDGLELRTLAEDGLRLARECGDRWVVAMAHLAAGVASHRCGDLDAARCYHEKGLAIVRELGESFNVAPQLFWLANVCREQGDLSTARARMEEAITTLRSLDAKPMLADVLIELGSILLDQGDIEGGIALEEEALSQARECGATREMSLAMRYLAHADALRGDHAGAAARYEEAFTLVPLIGEQIRGA
jgi:tetratricopeptide (TPR) repeat protein